MEWTEEIIAQLKDLWAEGLSTAEIGRRLSITKNAVVGKAHRLGLPARPSPIRRDGKAKPAVADKAPSPTTVDAAHPQTPVAPPVVAVAQPGTPPATVVAAVAPAITPKAEVPAEPAVDDKLVRKEKIVVSPRPAPKSKATFSTISDPEPQKRRGPSCCWPIGDPGTPGFHFCGAQPLPGKPYCEEHAQIAYVRLRDRRDTMA